jgi:hypothetical protein
LLPATASGRTWFVAVDGSGDAPTIQAGIDSAQAGDEVVLGPGTYTRTAQGDNGDPLNLSMVVLENGVNLQGQVGPEATVLDGEDGARLVWGSNVGAMRIEGLTFTGGLASGAYGGGAIAIIGNSTPTISNCIIRDNRAGEGLNGGGLYSELPTTLTIARCQILNNRTMDGFGGGLVCRAGSIDSSIFRGNESHGQQAVGGALLSRGMLVRDCTFQDNRASGWGLGSGGAIRDSGGSQISRCTFIRNKAEAASIGNGLGGGIYAFGACVISECIFVGNVAVMYPAGGAVYGSSGNVSVERCTIVGNAALDPGGTPWGTAGVVIHGPGNLSNSIIAFNRGSSCSVATSSCNLFFGNGPSVSMCDSESGGNIMADPQFCATDPTTSLSFLLQSDSPCAPVTGGCGLIGAAPVGCGSVQVAQPTWSQVKTLFR